MSTALPVVGACFPLKPGLKEPAISAWQVVGPGIYPAVGNHGIALAANVLVLDGDPRNYPPGRDVLAEILAAYPEMLPTYVVKTPRGGYHVYLNKPADLKFKKQQSAYPGIDFLSSGFYVCGAGTTTIETPNSAAGTYMVHNPAQIAEAPAEFLAGLERYSERMENGADVTLLHSKTFKSECLVHPPAERGSRGIETYKLACVGRDHGLPCDVTYEHIRDSWNPRNLPPEGDVELYRVTKSAYSSAKNAAGSRTPDAKFTPDMAAPGPVVDNVVSIADHQHERVQTTIHQQALTLKKDGYTIENTQGNRVYLLRYDQAWKGRIFYNQFAERLELRGKPDWRRDVLSKDEAITDYDIAYMQAWFSAAQKMEVGTDAIKNACIAASTSYHPVLDYLDEIEWDGVPRLDTMMRDTLGCTDNEYTRAASACLMIALVKRVREPGSKQDYVVVLESRQGTKKSAWVEALGGAWASTGELVPGDKDTYQNMRGKWVIELPEINATFSKADHAWLKKIITQATDTYRKSFGSFSQSIPRESVFIATINPDATGEYLKDSENRRYWPIATDRIDVEKLKQNRDQYFAEAQHRYRAGERPWLTAHGAAEIAKQEQELRRERDPWLGYLAECIEMAEDKRTISPKAVYACLGLNGERVTYLHRRRVYAIMRELGYVHKPGQGSGTWKKEITWEDLV